jgi:hypothetical protein
MTQISLLYFLNRLNVCLLFAEKSWIEAKLGLCQLEHQARGSNIDLELEKAQPADVQYAILEAKRGVEATRRVAREARAYLVEHRELLQDIDGADRIVESFGQLDRPLELLHNNLCGVVELDRTQELGRVGADRLAELYGRWSMFKSDWRAIREIHEPLEEQIQANYLNADPW